MDKYSTDYYLVDGSIQQTSETWYENILSMEICQTKKWKKIIQVFPKLSCVLLAIILALVIIVILLPLRILEPKNDKLSFHVGQKPINYKCHEKCNIQLVESIPDGLNFSQCSPKFMSTFEAWTYLLDLGNDTLDIGSFYWTLLGDDVVNHTSALDGETIFKNILFNGRKKKYKIRVAQNAPKQNEPNKDTDILVKNNAAYVKSVNFTRLLGNGVLHTKLWIVDNKHFYLGSANMDWRSLTQVKELGVLVTNCSCLTRDVQKIFEAYWYLGGNASTVPKEWPKKFATDYNYDNPLDVYFNGSFHMLTFFSNSPPPLSAKGRTNDLDSIINTILSAKSFVNIAVMDYFPLLIYTTKLRYWPYIDDTIRKAALENKVSIKMLISWWPHSKPSEDYFLKSLTSLSSSLNDVDIQIRRFIVPSNDDQKKIPYGRVNHNKYMVTDNTAYIGTSNWAGDYFTSTAGIGFVLQESEFNNKAENNLRLQLLSVFKRDWESNYSVKIH